MKKISNNTTVKRWKNENGNICFQIPMQKPVEKGWICISVLLSFIICCIEYFIWNSCILPIPLMIIFVLFYLYVTYIPLKQDEIIIEKTVHEIMDKVVENDAIVIGAKIVKSCINYDTKGTYGIVTGICLLVLLDNNQVWEYPIIYKINNKQNAYYECKKEYIISKDQKHIRKISTNKSKRPKKRIKLSEKTSLGLLLTMIFVIGGFIFIGILWLCANYLKLIGLTFSSFILLIMFLDWIYEKHPSKLLNIIIYALFIPVNILIKLLHPFIIIFFSYFFLSIFAFGVPLIILKSLSIFGYLVLKPETMLFVIFSIGSIICANYYKISKWVIRQSPFKNRGNHDYEKYVEELSIYLIHPSNLIFILYLIYFLFLSISGFQQIEYDKYLISQEFDTAILKAFLVFMAFTNMRMKSKEIKIDAKELFIKTMKLFVHDK